MATDTSGTAPHTALVPGEGSSTVAYTLPAGLYQYIQSVVATVDTSGSGAVTALLTIRDDGGQVVADKEQGAAIAGGGSGRATWALRLTDEGAGAAAVTIQSASYSGNNVNIAPGATGTITWDSFDAGDDLLNLSVPGTPTVRKAGMYIVTSEVSCGTAGISFRQFVAFASAGPGSAATGLTGDLSGLGATGWVTLTIAAQLAAGDGIVAQVLNQGGLAANFNEVQGSVVRIA